MNTIKYDNSLTLLVGELSTIYMDSDPMLCQHIEVMLYLIGEHQNLLDRFDKVLKGTIDHNQRANAIVFFAQESVTFWNRVNELWSKMAKQ